MKTGRLKHPIFFKVPTSSKSELGTPIETFKDMFDEPVFCDIQTVRENETFISKEVKTTSEIKFIIAYLPNIDTSLVIEHYGKQYEVLDVINPFFSNKELQIFAKAVK